MKLNQSTIEILTNFAAVSPNLQFKAGNVVKSKSPRSNIRAEVILD